MGGASGAISACMGMYLLLRAGADIEFKYFAWFFFIYVRAGEFEIPAWMAISFWFLNDLLWAVLGMVNKHSGGGVAFGAHVGGFLGGLALVAIYKWLVRPREEEAAPPDLIIDPVAMIAEAKARNPAGPATSETPTFFLHDGTGQTGPFTLTQVQAKLSHGEISRDALYWSDGMEDWQSVVELSGQPIA
jgi:hypothetical protein